MLRRPNEFAQFTAWGFSELIRAKHLTGSMGTVGDCLFTGYSLTLNADEPPMNTQDLAA